MQMIFKRQLLERFRQVVDEAFSYGYECGYNAYNLWFACPGQRIVFPLSRRGLRAARRWLVRLDRLALAS